MIEEMTEVNTKQKCAHASAQAIRKRSAALWWKG